MRTVNLADAFIATGYPVTAFPLARFCARHSWPDDDKVARFTAAMIRGEVFPPVLIGTGCCEVPDGSHRIAAALRLGLACLPAVILALQPGAPGADIAAAIRAAAEAGGDLEITIEETPV